MRGSDSLDRPLLASDDADQPHSHPPSRSSAPLPRRGTRRHNPKAMLYLRRLTRPLLILGIPLLLVLLYHVVRPYAGLPGLPRVRIESSSNAALGDSASQQGFSHTQCLCGDTQRGKDLCDIYSREGLVHSRLMQGSGARTRKLMMKARDGGHIKIGVLGGSVSACRGVHPSPHYPEGDPGGPGCYTTLVREWFEETFPKSTFEVQNGAIGGSDSSYYAFCGTHHIATDADLIVLEFDVNDQSDLIYQTFFDQLLRVLLEFDSLPAIVILGAWAPQIAQDVGYGDPQIVHLPIAHYYDIPYISLKRLIFNHYTRFPQSTAKTFFLPDTLHPNARGHRLLADLAVAYLESELCLLNHFGLPVTPALEATIATHGDAASLVDTSFDMPQPVRVDGQIDWSQPPEGWEATFDKDKIHALGKERRHFALPQTPYTIPFVSMFTPLRDLIDSTKPDPTTPGHILNLVQPNMFCADANDQQHPMKPHTAEGWEPYVWNEEKHYWVSSTVGAKIRVDIKVNAGRVAVYYFRSQHYDLGDALCWVDDNEHGAINLPGYWDRTYNMAMVHYIDQNVTQGDHYVTCKVSDNTSHPINPEAHHFRIVAVMAT